MPCGCSANKKSNDKLSLDSLTNLSIDQIINLYRQGYRLENSHLDKNNQNQNNIGIQNQSDIKSLQTASPGISRVGAFFNSFFPYTGTVMVLWNNSGSYGYVDFIVYDENNNLMGQTKVCANTRTSPWNYLNFVDIGPQTVTHIVDVYSHGCNDPQLCMPPSCTSLINTVTNLSNGVQPDVGATPSQPPNPAAQEMDGSLRVTWGESTISPSSYIFCYEVRVWRDGNEVYLPIYTRENARDITIDGLTNGTLYTIEISAKSFDNVDGPIATVTGTPHVTVQTLGSISIAPSTASINIGGTQQLTATCKDTNNNAMTCPSLTWSSNNNSKATVNSSGLVTGVANGTANITASGGGKTSNISAITVITPPVLTSITITPTTSSINIGGIVNPNAVCKDQNNATMTCPTLTWASNNTAVATVNPSTGLVTGISAGIANITTSASGITSNPLVVTVTGTTSVLTSIQISPTTASVAPGSTRQFTAICKDQNNSSMICPTLTWTSSDISKGIINSVGLFSGIAVGTTNITATAGLITSNIAVATVTTTPPPAAGSGGALIIAGIAALGLAYYMMKKPKI